MARSYNPAALPRTITQGFLQELQKGYSGGVPAQSSALIGSNLTPGGLPVYNNLATSAFWQDGDSVYHDAGGSSGLVTADGNLQNIPSGFRMYFRGMQPAPIPGQETEVSWREPSNSTQVSRWDNRLTTYYDYSWADPSPITFSNGKFRKRGKYRLDPNQLATDSGGLLLTSLADGGSFADITVLPVGQSASTGFRQSYIDTIIMPLRGAMRHMETLQTNAWWMAYDWADRVTPLTGAYGNTGRGFAPARFGQMLGFSKGIAAETLIDLHNLSQRNVKFLIGYRWSDDLITKWMQALFRGSDMLQGQKLAANLLVSVALVGNEHFNPGFTGLYEQLVDESEAVGITQGSANDRRVKMAVLRSNHVREVILAAVPEFAHRLRFLWAGSPGNHEFEFFEVAKPFGLVGIDAVETSLYWGIYINKQSFGNNTPEELDTPWSINMDQQVADALRALDRYKAAGIERELYEIGVDLKDTVLTVPQQEAWIAAPQYHATLRRGMLQVGRALNTDMSLYTDTGGSHRSWPFYQNPPLLSPKWQTALAVQAELQAN